MELKLKLIVIYFHDRGVFNEIIEQWQRLNGSSSAALIDLKMPINFSHVYCLQRFI